MRSMDVWIATGHANIVQKLGAELTVLFAILLTSIMTLELIKALISAASISETRRQEIAKELIIYGSQLRQELLT